MVFSYAAELPSLTLGDDCETSLINVFITFLQKYVSMSMKLDSKEFSCVSGWGEEYELSFGMPDGVVKSCQSLSLLWLCALRCFSCPGEQ